MWAFCCCWKALFMLLLTWNCLICASVLCMMYHVCHYSRSLCALLTSYCLMLFHFISHFKCIWFCVIECDLYAKYRGVNKASTISKTHVKPSSVKICRQQWKCLANVGCWKRGGCRLGSDNFWEPRRCRVYSISASMLIVCYFLKLDW